MPGAASADLGYARRLPPVEVVALPHLPRASATSGSPGLFLFREASLVSMAPTRTSFLHEATLLPCPKCRTGSPAT
jgi:hypothetical protein